MKPIIYWIDEAAWRRAGENRFKELRIRRGRLRVQQPESVAYFYIEDRSQMKMIYEAWNEGKREIALELHLQDREAPEIVQGIPKPEAPPFHAPPYHLKMRFPFETLSFAEDLT